MTSAQADQLIGLLWGFLVLGIVIVVVLIVIAVAQYIQAVEPRRQAAADRERILRQAVQPGFPPDRS